jgi:multiple sugar transport system substrate-binding protein
MKRSILRGFGLAAVTAVAVAGCSSSGSGSGSGSGGSTPTSAGAAASSASAGGASPSEPSAAPVTLTMSGWSLSTTPEFKTLADAFHEAHPNITIQIKEYDASNYDTQMTADLAAGKAPDIYELKNLQDFITYQSGGQLMDVSDVAASYSGGAGTLSGLDDYKVDGKYYAIPYRQDSWVLFYNKDLFAKAGVADPDGKWTWDDFVTNAEKLTTNLKAAGDSSALGTYFHTWQSVIQGFAQSQTPGASVTGDDYSYLKPYYQRALELQSKGAMLSFNTATTQKASYQTEFGKQNAAMMVMGTWYVATLLAQQASGDADKFSWGIAPAPQYDSSTFNNPVTFGDPTGMAINPAIDKSKVAAAKEFLGFVGGQDAASDLAKIGITPAYMSDQVTQTFFSAPGAPTDQLSEWTFSNHTTKPENPVSKYTQKIQSILNDEHTAIMSGSKSIDSAIADADKRVKNEALNQ